MENTCFGMQNIDFHEKSMIFIEKIEDFHRKFMIFIEKSCFSSKKCVLHLSLCSKHFATFIEKNVFSIYLCERNISQHFDENTWIVARWRTGIFHDFHCFWDANLMHIHGFPYRKIHGDRALR